ncbi:MAG: APC family permease, partial [Gemmatimonadales bacterium]
MSASSEAPRGSLLKVLGVAFGIAMIVGNTIGVGILRTPGEIAAQLPSAPWFYGVWLVGGVYALLGALTLAELGAMIPKSGGQYIFARRALGEYAGFTIGWTDTISSAASTAAITISMGEYSDALFPPLAGHATAVAVTLVVALVLVNWRGIKAGDLTQQVTSVLKTVVLVGLAVLCLFTAPAPSASSASSVLSVSSAFPGLALVVLALQGVIYTYDGWNGVLYFSGEVKNPGREIPRAMAGGVLVVVGIYFLLLIGYSHVLTLPGMAGDKLVAASTARVIFGTAGDRIVRAIILVSLLSAANAIVLLTSRVPYAMARDGLLWRRMGDVNTGGTPVISLAITAAIAIGLILSGTFGQVLALASFFFVFQYAISFVSLIVLRRREPDTPRPFRIRPYPWLPFFLLLGALAFLAGNLMTDTRNSLWSVALLVGSWPVFRLMKGAGS